MRMELRRCEEVVLLHEAWWIEEWEYNKDASEIWGNVLKTVELQDLMSFETFWRT